MVQQGFLAKILFDRDEIFRLFRKIIKNHYGWKITSKICYLDLLFVYFVQYITKVEVPETSTTIQKNVLATRIIRSKNELFESNVLNMIMFCH